MNNDNLIPFDKLTEEQHREIATKGGIKSGEIRRQKKTMKQFAAIIGQTAVSGKNKDALEKLGIENEDAVNSALLVASIFNAAAKGNVKAQKLWLELNGELDKNININTSSDKLNGILKQLESDDE